MVRVTAVHPDSLAAELDLEPGSELLAIDGHELHDFLDWEFRAAEERFTLLVRTPAGELVEYDVERPEELRLGVELEPPSIRRCANLCDFCFVDGLPPGLRDSLYVRDDDYRLSFRYGNFATLTNLKPRDVERIIAYRLSPLYVSVHATDPVIRRRLLRNPRAPDIVPQLEQLGAHGIRFHTQIVLQPGVNDGAVLECSLEDLYALGEVVLSASVVPVGLTEYSKHHLVRQPTPAECRAAIICVERIAARALAARGCHWAYGSDELYLVAGIPLPPAERYDDFEQVENGVGSVRWLQRRILEQRGALPSLRGRRLAVLTGAAMEPLMPRVLDTLREETGGAFELLPLVNDLFGPSVTAAGLLPGRAFLRALAGRRGFDLALLPAEALNDRGRFLDDLTLDELAAGLAIEVRPSYDFADALGPPPGDTSRARVAV
jgi:putative radical SAM enzyme (TIGR03279 family)